DRAPFQGELDQTEVEDLRLASPRDKDVGRFDVTMNHALRVRRLEGLGNLDTNLDDLVDGQGPGDAVLQCLALQQLHREEGLPFVFPKFVNCADVWMIEGRGGAGFALEALQGSAVVRQLL